LNTSRDVDSTPPLGRLFQCITTLSENKFFIISNLNLPCNIKPLHFALYLLLMKENIYITAEVKCTKMYSRVCWSTGQLVLSHVILKLAIRLSGSRISFLEKTS